MSAAPIVPDFVIEPAVSADEDALVALLLAQLAEHAIDTPEAEVRFATHGLIDRLDRGFLLVARVTTGGAPIGVAFAPYCWTLEHGGQVTWLEELYVIPARRDAGIGTALLRAVMARAKELGCVAMDLEVETSHVRAARLYERHGFRPLDRVHWTRRL